MLFEAIPGEAVFTAVDFESAGVTKGGTDTPIQIGLVVMHGMELATAEPFVSYLHTQRPITWQASQVHGITTADLKDAPSLTSLWPEVKARLGGRIVVAQDHELLMVRPPCPDPHVEQALAAGGIDLLTQVSVLRGGECQAVPVGAPKETTNIDVASGRVREHPSDFAIRGAGEAFVGVPAPVDEHEQVTITHLRYPVVQLREIRRAMDERTHQVALGPRHATVMTRVQSGRGVSARA